MQAAGRYATCTIDMAKLGAKHHTIHMYIITLCAYAQQGYVFGCVGLCVYVCVYVYVDKNGLFGVLPPKNLPLA